MNINIPARTIARGVWTHRQEILDAIDLIVKAVAKAS